MTKIEITIVIPTADAPSTADVEAAVEQVQNALQTSLFNSAYPDTLIGLVGEGVPYSPWQTIRSSFRTRARRHACAS